MMRILVAAVLMMVATSAVAAGSQDKYWRECTQDAECILIDGTCDKTAVNKLYEPEAKRYYHDLAKRAECVDKFWVPKDVIAQCKPLAGSKPRVTAEVEPHSTCAVVAKPAM